jgi:hypothetical protein
VRRVFASPAAARVEQKRIEHILEHQIIPLAEFESATRTMRKLARKGPVDRGHYRHGWEVRRKVLPTSAWARKTRLGLAARTSNVSRTTLVNTTPYSGVIEQGARPFWAPIKPLIDWASRKAGALGLAGILKISPKSFTPRADGSLRFRGRASLNKGERAEVRSFAYAVRANIAKYGLPAHWIMRNHIPYAAKILENATNRRLRILTNTGHL